MPCPKPTLQPKHWRRARLAWPLFCLVAFCLSTPITLRSHQDLPKPGIVKVLVHDAHGRGVSGAVCQFVRVAEPSLVLSATTDEQGIATFPALPAGAYTLYVETQGFESFIRGDVLVKDGATTSIELSLTVAALKESVTVESQGEEATTAAAGSSIPAGTLHREALQRLPLA